MDFASPVPRGWGLARAAPAMGGTGTAAAHTLASEAGRNNH